MAFTEILTANGLTEEQWDNNIFAEYLGPNWWKFLMRQEKKGSDGVIVTKPQLTKGVGDAITFVLASRVVGVRVQGTSKGIGSEGKMDFFNQRIVIDNDRVLVKITDVPMTNKRVGFDVLTKAKNGLVIEAGVNLEEDITTALSVVTTGRVQGRYLYGALDSNYNATHATALQNVDNTDDKLTGKMISITKRKALIPKNAVAKIRPARFVNGKAFEEWYVLVAHPYAIRDLVDGDAAWKNAQLLLPPSSNQSSVIRTGSSFKGAWNGVLVYEYDRILLESSSIQIAHNLFLGAQAGAVVWGQTPKFGEEPSDLGHDMTFEVHEIRNIAKLVFNRATEEDHGVVHLFTAGVSD